MRRISTLFASFCLFVITNSSFAQTTTGTMSTTPSTPTPGFGPVMSVSLANGFDGRNMANNAPTTIITDFPKGQTTQLTSPAFHYTTPTSTIYFKYNFSMASNATTTTTPIVSILFGGQTYSFTASQVVFSNNGGDYYFTITPSVQLPANTDFVLKLTMTIANNDKAISALNFMTNAILSGSNAPLPLPVKLVNFSGSVNKNRTQLQWMVAENETARNFEIQRSTNGIDFTTAGTVSASTKSGDENYSFTENISAERVMYRLKMYDNNYKAEYSKILVFNSSLSTQKSLQVITNPVREKLIISFTNDMKEAAQVTIYDHTGRTIQKQSLNVNAGVNTTTVALNGNYTNGMYIVELATQSTRLSQKVMYSNQ
jgi:hypothetical protein